jgi:S1-C subfamily serine protease
MSETSLLTLSNQMADAVASLSPSVVQVQGRRRPASGVVYAPHVVVTMARALGREDGLRVRPGGGEAVEAEAGGWDPATGLVVLRAPGLDAPPVTPAEAPARVGHLAVAVARSWSNAVTASFGVVSVIGGPLPTWRGRQIDQVIRTTAPMHEGFAGGAFASVDGRLLGVATSAAIRGLGVVIPAAIVWKTAAALVEHGSITRGYLGVAGQAVRLDERQRATSDRSAALLVVAVSPGSPAATGGLIVGDVVIDFDGRPVESAVDLLDLLASEHIGRAVPVRLLRGGAVQELTVTVGERPRQ